MGCSRSDPRVVLYCAQDREFAESIIDDFTIGSGISIVPKFDTEANKSVSLFEELVREANHPRCDVHWNNEIINTIRLQQKGLLEPYESPSASAFPDWARAKDRTWTAFAGRARVLIINTNLVPESERPKSLLELTDPKWKGKICMAKPQFGTTATQAACLFDVLGADRAKAFYRGLKSNDVAIVAGNKQSAVAVGQGRYAIGLTDTDDAMAEVDAKQPVVLIFTDRDGHPEFPRMGTLFIPNTAAIIKGAPNSDAAKKFVDYLLSPGVEQKLAEGPSRQIPLNPNVEAKLPAQIVTPKQAKPMAADFVKAAEIWDEVQTFLRAEFAQ